MLNDRVRIVLVRPQTGGNVGSTARAMLNMGVSDLVLVSPDCDPLDEQARMFAARARPMLETIRVVASIAAATADCTATFATSAKSGFHRRRAALNAREAGELIFAADFAGRAAIAFGPEDRGLLQEEILQFDRVIEIPTNPDYAALNLAAAVTVVAYELRMAFLKQTGQDRTVHPDPPATDDRKRVMYDRLFSALAAAGFFEHQQSEDHLKYALRRILGRVDLSINEVDVLIGMALQIQKLADRDSKRSPQ